VRRDAYCAVCLCLRVDRSSACASVLMVHRSYLCVEGDEDCDACCSSELVGAPGRDEDEESDDNGEEKLTMEDNGIREVKC
jgi:hypothetical protein